MQLSWGLSRHLSGHLSRKYPLLHDIDEAAPYRGEKEDSETAMKQLLNSLTFDDP